MPPSERHILVTKPIRDSLRWMQESALRTMSTSHVSNPEAVQALRFLIDKRIELLLKSKQIKAKDFNSVSFDFAALTSSLGHFQMEIIYPHQIREILDAPFADRSQQARLVELGLRPNFLELPIHKDISERDMSFLISNGIYPLGVVDRVHPAHNGAFGPKNFIGHDRTHNIQMRSVAELNQFPALTRPQKAEFFKNYDAWRDRIATSDEEKNFLNHFYYDATHEALVAVSPRAFLDYLENRRPGGSDWPSDQ